MNRITTTGLVATVAILAFNTVTNVNNPGTVVTGDLGISPGAALVGFPPGQVVGAGQGGEGGAREGDAAGLQGGAVAGVGAVGLLEGLDAK